jgi:hypothetical protein
MNIYCKRCYAKLPPEEPKYPAAVPDVSGQVPLSYATDMSGRCPECRKRFNYGRPRTYLQKPFPSRRRVILNIVLTTAIGIFVAMVVAVFQMPALRAGGH